MEENKKIEEPLSESDYTDDDKDNNKDDDPKLTVFMEKYPHLSKSRVKSLMNAWNKNSEAKVRRKKDRKELMELRKLHKSKKEVKKEVKKEEKKKEVVKEVKKENNFPTTNNFFSSHGFY